MATALSPAANMQKPNLLAAFLRITVYYAIITCVLSLILGVAPWVADYLPIGAAERLFSTPAGSKLLMHDQPITHTMSQLQGQSLGGQVVYLLLCFGAAILVAMPVKEVYLATAKNDKKGLDASAIKMILLLPVSVAGLVLIVQNSLALAFSLAGLIAGAGVRFRTKVREMSDTLFFMVSISVGLASGVGALGIAALMSMVFCYTTLLIHARHPGGEPDSGDKDSDD